jgi:hypothetical protein
MACDSFTFLLTFPPRIGIYPLKSFVVGNLLLSEQICFFRSKWTLCSSSVCGISVGVKWLDVEKQNCLLGLIIYITPKSGMINEFHVSLSSRPTLRQTQPLFKLLLGALSPGVKRSRREPDYSFPTSADVKNTWIYTSTSSWRIAYLSTETTSFCTCHHAG